MSDESYEWLCRRIVEDTPEAIVFADAEGVIRLWNAGAEALFGLSREEAIGRTLDLIVPERHRDLHWEGYRRVMKTGVTKYGTELLKVPALRKDGTRISLEFSVALLRDADGGVAGAAAVIRDVTARWQKDKALRERLATLEAQTARDVQAGRA
jgi:PAS domain S-box-containing protein